MQMSKKNFTKKYNKIIIISLVILLAALLAVALVSIAKLADKHFYEGIHIGDLDVSGMTVTEAEDAVLARYQNALSGTITLAVGEYEKTVLLSELKAELDVADTVRVAYSLGRSGSAISRLKLIGEIKEKNTVIYPTITCDEATLSAMVGELSALIDVPEQQMQVTFTENEMIITRGKPGKRLLPEAAIERFKNEALLYIGSVLRLEPDEILPEEPDAEKLYDEYCGEPKDAEYKIENQKLTIEEEKNGVMFNKEEVKKLIEETTGDIISIPVVITPAEKTAEQIENELFSDLLGRYSTNYNAGDTARSHNVSLASEKINGVVLAPGDVFSYNDTVGPRTIERGFRTANVYVGNKVEPGIGGGICQVSSTLFNAVVLSDLKIVYRTNHSLPVSYVPLGRDATVSYGSIDFKFSNSTNAPIKIVASASGGKNVISIYGIKDNKNRTIEITTQNTGVTPANLIQKENPELPVGTIEVEEAGSNGSSYVTYKITKENGSVVKTEVLTKSTYVPTDRIEIIGTAPVPSAETGAEPVAPVEGSASPAPTEAAGTAVPSPETSASVPAL